jgi:hypothetical protein
MNDLNPTLRLTRPRFPMHVYEVRPRKDHRGVDLISDALPFGRLWYGGPEAAANAIRKQTLIELTRTADSSSINAVSFSSARTMKRFLSRCASAIQMVRPASRRLGYSPPSVYCLS